MIALGDDIRVLIIKLADRLHNVRTLSALPPDKQKKIAKETLEIFAPLADRLNMGQLRVELADLAFKYVNPKRFNELKPLITKRNKSRPKVFHKNWLCEIILSQFGDKWCCDKIVRIHNFTPTFPNTTISREFEDQTIFTEN